MWLFPSKETESDGTWKSDLRPFAATSFERTTRRNPSGNHSNGFIVRYTFFLIPPFSLRWRDGKIVYFLSDFLSSMLYAVCRLSHTGLINRAIILGHLLEINSADNWEFAVHPPISSRCGPWFVWIHSTTIKLTLVWVLPRIKILDFTTFARLSV